MNLANQPLDVSLPAAPLRPYISHYWLSLNNHDEIYSIVPDGAVDVVVVSGSAAYRVDAFGTTTKNTDVQLDVGKHYLGIRFRPGQSRHFLDAKTSELTNTVRSAEGGFLPDMLRVAESVSTESLFARLDAVLLQHLKRQSPGRSRIDEIICYIEATQGPVRVSELSNMYCKSRRQFERAFLDVVGLPPKLFAEIIRFRRASALLAESKLPIAEIAANLGYTDQSHLAHEFARFLGQTPSRLREHAAFLQDGGRFTEHNGTPFTVDKESIHDEYQ
ncbi:AraC family transcriptional regulator [Aquisalimonas lutea]|uniref:helix-turn-helix domain-containing protein n=1 Tax=Aquisalimonas lutea TaxID=1327750 RepID=UPI0025B4F747|nr:AraC family transcriptional regulator [Aquisalimonas lutea]MDN3517512.1 AraC family transcriptional regulator [Aquisalimonas lutea]